MAVSAEIIQLQNNPFSDQVDSLNYFEDEQRADIRQKICYFLEFGTDIVFVHGSLESGKTTIIQHIIEEKRKEWDSCYVSAQDSNNIGSLLGVLAKCYNIKQSEPEAILSDLAERLTEIHSKGKMATLFIDDAHQLNAPIFKLISSITGIKISGQPVLRIALIGRSIPKELTEQIASLNSKSDLTRVEVPPLTEEQTSTYITHRLAVAGSHNQSTFNATTIQKIYKQSRGQPSHINALAYTRISQPNKTENTGKPTNATSSDNHFGLKVIAFALAISVIASLFFFRSNQDGDSNQDVSPLTIPEIAQSEETIIPPKLIPEPKPAKPETSKPTAEVKVEVAQQQPEKMTETPQPNVVAEPAPVKQEPETNVLNDEPKTWIRSQPGNHFTLQLVALGSQNAAKTFLVQNKIVENSAYFETIRNGKTYYAVIHGSFDNRKSAQDAAQGLPKGMGISKPWIRSFASIQKQLK